MTTLAYDAQSLVPTATKISAYTAAVNDLVIVDGTSSSVPITLPTAPANLSVVGVKRQDATYTQANIPTVSPGGTDAFLGGSTTAAQLPLQGQTSIFQYSSSRSQWILIYSEKPLNQLDSRYTNGLFLPSDYGYISWNYDPTRAYVQSTAATAGQAYLELLPIRTAATITNVIVNVGVAGASLTSGQCFAGLFDKNGNLLSATADQSTNWQTTGLKVMALATPQAVSAGLYYVGWFVNGTTPPKFSYDGAASSNVARFGQLSTVPRSVVDTTNTGLTTAFHSPATLNPALIPYWAAVS